MAEREGFEPPIPFRVCRFSRPEPSTTRPPLRLIQFYYSLNFTAGRQARSNRVAYIRVDSQTMYREWQLRAALAWTAALWWLSLRDSWQRTAVPPMVYFGADSPPARPLAR